MALKFIIAVSLICILCVSCKEDDGSKKSKLSLFACNELKKNLITNDHLKLLQGAWQNDKNEIYYVNDNSYSVFEFKKFSKHYFELAQDTLNFFAMIDLIDTRNSIIVAISKDSLIVKCADEVIRRFWRPSSEALQKDTVMFTVINKEIKIIAGNELVFSVISDYEDHFFLQVHLKNCTDSCVKLVHDLWFRGGNCNWTSKGEGVYEVKKDSLIIYSEDEEIEHMDDTHPHGSTDYIKEIYLIRKNGRIVRVKTEKGEAGSKTALEFFKKYSELKWKKN